MQCAPMKPDPPVTSTSSALMRLLIMSSRAETRGEVSHYPELQMNVGKGLIFQAMRIASDHAVAHAGRPTPIFSDNAKAKIHKRSLGIPRRINPCAFAPFSRAPHRGAQLSMNLTFFHTRCNSPKLCGPPSGRARHQSLARSGKHAVKSGWKGAGWEQLTSKDFNGDSDQDGACGLGADSSNLIHGRRRHGSRG